MTTTEPNTNLTDADLAAALTSMTDRFRTQARATEQYAALGRNDSVPALLRAACLAMERPVVALALTLRVELGIAIGAEMRELLLGVAQLKHALTDQFRRETHIGCVDRAIQTIVQKITPAPLDADQWRQTSAAIHRTASAIELIAIDVLDLIEANFGFASGPAAQDRYDLLLGLPQIAHQGIKLDRDIYAASNFAIFERLAARL